MSDDYTSLRQHREETSVRDILAIIFHQYQSAGTGRLERGSIGIGIEIEHARLELVRPLIVSMEKISKVRSVESMCDYRCLASSECSRS